LNQLLGIEGEGEYANELVAGDKAGDGKVLYQ